MKKIKIKTASDVVELVNMTMGHIPPNSLVLVLKQHTTGPGDLNGTIRLDFTEEIAEKMSRSTARHVAKYTEKFSEVNFVIPLVSSDTVAHAFGHGDAPPDYGRTDMFVQAVDQVQRALADMGMGVAEAVWIGHQKCGWMNNIHHAQPAPACETATELPELSKLPHVRPLVYGQLESLREIATMDELLAALIDDFASLATYVNAEESPQTWKSLQLNPRSVLAVEMLLATSLGTDVLYILLSGIHPCVRPENLAKAKPSDIIHAVATIPDETSGRYLAGGTKTRPGMSYAYAVLMYLKLVAVHVEEDVFPEVLGIVAWLEWAVGHNSYAQGFARSALALSDTCGPAGIVDSLVSNCVTSQWFGSEAA